MRTEKAPPIDPSQDDFDFADIGVRIADWKDSPHQVLEQVDDLLSSHGLEIVMVDTGSDEFAFKVERRG